jgi:hypothetical protein
LYLTESETFLRGEFMPKNSSRSRNSRSDDWGVTELVRERPIAAAAAAAGAAAAGLFLWSRRAAISQQLSNLSDQIGEWTEGMSSGGMGDDTAGLTTTGSTRSGARSRPASGTRGRSSTTGRNRGMTETGGGNASLGAHSGGAGTTAPPSGRGRASDNS